MAPFPTSCHFSHPGFLAEDRVISWVTARVISLFGTTMDLNLLHSWVVQKRRCVPACVWVRKREWEKQPNWESVSTGTNSLCYSLTSSCYRAEEVWGQQQLSKTMSKECWLQIPGCPGRWSKSSIKVRGRSWSGYQIKASQPEGWKTYKRQKRLTLLWFKGEQTQSGLFCMQRAAAVGEHGLISAD